MKLPARFTKRIATLTIAAIAITVMAVSVYAAVSLSIAATATITSGTPNLLLASVASSTSTCPAVGSLSYQDTGVSMAFGSLGQGTTSHLYACIENTGAQHNVAVSTTGLNTNTGTMIPMIIGGSNLAGSTLNGGSTTLVDFPPAIDSNAPTGSISFTITVS